MTQHAWVYTNKCLEIYYTMHSVSLVLLLVHKILESIAIVTK
jgi:hypothetical protein